MKFYRITENQAYEYIARVTKELHEKGIECEEISMHPAVIELGLNLVRCTTSGYGLAGQGEYSAIFVTDGERGYKVYDIYIDTFSPEDTHVDDITNSLGALDPEHQQCDIREPISMAILHYLELFEDLPVKYKKYANHG